MNEDKERDKIRKGMVKETLEKFERPNGEKKEVKCRKLDIKDEIEKVNNSNDSLKEMPEKQNNKEEASSVQIICKKLEKESSLKQDIERQKSLIETKEVWKVKDMLKPKDNTTFKESLRRKLDTKDAIGKVNKGRKNKNNNLKGEIEKRLKSIEKDIIYTQNNSQKELIKKIELLNTPLEIDRKRDNIAVLNTTELSDNKKTNRHVSNNICHKCKGYGHTKKQCDRHNKNVKRISKLEFEKDIINELMEIFNVNLNEIDQVKKEKELKSTNLLKINKRKRK